MCTKHRIVFLVLLVASLFACATRNSVLVKTVEFDDESDAWIGRHRDDVEAVLGRPSEVQEMPDGSRVLTFIDTKVRRYPNEVVILGLDDNPAPLSASAHERGKVDADAPEVKQKMKATFWVDADGVVTRYELGKWRKRVRPPKKG